MAKVIIVLLFNANYYYYIFIYLRIYYYYFVLGGKRNPSGTKTYTIGAVNEYAWKIRPRPLQLQ